MLQGETSASEESAWAAVSCLVEGRPDHYDALWRRASRRYRWLTTGLLAASRRPRVRAAIVPAAARVPLVFRTTVNLLGAGAGSKAMSRRAAAQID